MALLEVNETEWEKAFRYRYHSVFFDPKYLNIVKGAFEYELHYYVYDRRNNLVFAAALFSKNGKIVVPDGFTYNAIYIENGIGDIVYLQILEELLQALKLKFKKIALRLPPDITDVRPFIWAGFNINNRYTYLKKSYEPIEGRVRRDINKIKENLVFKEDTIGNENLKTSLAICFKYGLSKKFYKNYKSLFIDLAENHYLKSLSLYKNNEIVGTYTVLVDMESKTLYTLLLNDFGNKHIASYLNVAIFNWCVDNDIETVDMIGANEKGIANFKYSFKAVLTPYFLLNYDAKKVAFNNLTNRLKSAVKKILGK